MRTVVFDDRMIASSIYLCDCSAQMYWTGDGFFCVSSKDFVEVWSRHVRLVGGVEDQATIKTHQQYVLLPPVELSRVPWSHRVSNIEACISEGD